jgi:hypothetical protein
MGLELFKSKIFEVRGQKVMLDRDVAEALGVETKHLNENVKNSPKWGVVREQGNEEDFRIQLTEEENDLLQLRSNNSTAAAWSRSLPWAYTKLGCTFFGATLNSIQANLLAIQLAEVFVAVQENQYVTGYPHYKAKIDVNRLSHDLLESTLKIARLLGNDEPHARTYAVAYTAKAIPEFDHTNLLSQNKSDEDDYLVPPRDLGKSLDPLLSSQKVNTLLEELGLQSKNGITDKWETTPLARKLGMFAVVPQTSVNGGKTVDSLRWYYKKTLNFLVERKGLKLISTQMQNPY